MYLVVGGREGETYIPTTEILTDPVNGGWGHRGALPQAMVGIRLVSLDSGIIAAGGWGGEAGGCWSGERKG